MTETGIGRESKFGAQTSCPLNLGKTLHQTVSNQISATGLKGLEHRAVKPSITETGKVKKRHVRRQNDAYLFVALAAV